MDIFESLKSYYYFFIKKSALLLLKADKYYFIIFFFFFMLLVGLFTVPRFGDGIFHLETARSWFDSGLRPEYVYNQFVTESPLWYFLVQLLSRVFGDFHYFTAQFLQSILYSGILFFSYKITYLQTKSDIASKLTLLFVASIPMLAVTAAMCFIDVICAFFVILSIWFLLNEKFLWALLACVGVWYSKRTGVLELVVFFPLFAIYVFHNSNKNYIASFIRLAGYAILFLLLIAPEIIYRMLYSGVFSSYEVGYSTSYDAPVKLVHSAKAAAAFPLSDPFIWLGGVVACLFVLFPLGAFFMHKKGLLKPWFNKNFLLICIFILTVSLFACFSLGRATIRYWAIVIALPIISVTALLYKTKLRRLVILLGLAALIQYCLIMFYILEKRQLNFPEKQVLEYLKQVSLSKDIIWYEARFGRFYLHREVCWLEYLVDCLEADFNSKSMMQSVGAIVLTKRYLYNYNGIYYDRGIPYYILEKMKNNSNLKLVLENEEYYIFVPLNDDRN